MIFELLLSIIMGGVAGYATNNIAVNMLFKKYLKRFGGVILDHYDEFIDNFSLLIEEDLVNSASLKKEISEKPFKNAIQNLVHDIIQNELPKKTSGISIGEIAGIEQSFRNLAEQTRPLQKEFLKCIYAPISNKKIKNIISKEQYEHIVKKSVISLDIEGLFETQENKISNFLQECTPLFIDTIIDLIKKNKTELESIIDAVIDREFENEGVSAKIIIFFKNIFQINIIDLIIKKLQNDKYDIAKKIQYKIIQNIKTFLGDDAIIEKLFAKGDAVLDKKINSIITAINAIGFEIQSIDLNPILEKNKNKKINAFYSAIQNEDVYKKCSCGILRFLNNNMDTLLSNNVSAIAAKQLSKSTPFEVNDMVQDFMGRELKPINFIGLFLGALIGGISVLIANAVNVPNIAVWYMFAVNIAVFAGVGIATNALAIRMLFRPYTPIWHLNFPPFLGVVAAKKSAFAKNISTFVKEKTLSYETLCETFFNNKDKIKEAVKIKVSKNNYQIIDDFLAKRSRLDVLSVFLYGALKKYISNNTESVSSELCDFIQDMIKSGKIDRIVTLDHILSIVNIDHTINIDHTVLKSFLKNNIDFIIELISKWAASEKNSAIQFMYKCLDSPPFWAAVFLEIIGVKDHVSNIADSLFDTELPKFLKSKKADIAASIDYLLENIPIDALISDIKADIESDLKNRLHKIFTLPEIIDYEILQRDLQIFLETFIQNDLSYNDLSCIENSLIEDSLQEILKSFIKNINHSLASETKDAIFIDYFLDSALNSCINQTPLLISSLDLQSLIEGEINNMHSSEIEKLFYKFAGKYFKKLIFYGWIGLFAGAISYGISCLLRLF